MFVKRKEIRTLEENFGEAIKVEKDLASISIHQGNEESEASTLEKNGKKNKEKESDWKDRVILQLQSEIMNLERNKGDGKKLVKKKINKNTSLKSLLLQELTWKTMRWTTFVVHIMQIIQRNIVQSL